MRYLYINGGPRKGNTWKLAMQIKMELSALAPEAEFQELHLPELQLPFCSGCSACFRIGGACCPHRAQMQPFFDALDWCDGLIFASATFNMQPTALTKNLIDHISYLLHRPAYFSKKAIILSTAGGVGAGQTVKSLAGLFCGIGFNRCYPFSVPAYSWNAYEIKEKTKRRCKKLARQFHHDVASRKLHAPSAMVMIPYNLFRGMSIRYAPGTPYETEDGIHWTDPARIGRTYDPSVPVPFYKKPIGHLFYFMGKTMSKRIEVTYQK